MRKVILACGILLGLLVLVLGLLAFRFRSFVGSFLSSGGGRINILVLGKGGIGHEAPDLTDTIILASVSEEKISLISVPRDIWVPEIRAKLNSAYYWGKLPLAKSTVEKITGQSVPYGLVIDFSGFKGLIDALGGTEVNIQNSFVDEKYPIPGKENDSCIPCRYETVRFEKGAELMNGERALKFVRSRNAVGEEGTDLAREARQQIVIEAVKNKLTDPKTFLSFGRLKALKKVLSESIETDIDLGVLGRLVRKAYGAKFAVFSSVIPGNLLLRPPISARYDNQYVFIPKNGSWVEVSKWIKGVLD